MGPVHRRCVSENGECVLARDQQNGGPCSPETAVRVLIGLRSGAHPAEVAQAEFSRRSKCSCANTRTRIVKAAARDNPGVYSVEPAYGNGEASSE
jgi:hypothetical protein